MKIQHFITDSPLGLGWIMGHIPLRQAVEALAGKLNMSSAAVEKKYAITTKDYQEMTRSEEGKRLNP